MHLSNDDYHFIRHHSHDEEAFASLITFYERMQQATRGFEQLLHLSIDLLCISGLDGYYRWVSPSFTATLGFTFAELISQPYLHFVHEQDHEQTLQAHDQLQRGQVLIDFENRLRCKNGDYRWLQWRAQSAREDGLIYAVARDITEQKRDHDRLRRSEQTYRSIARHFPNGIIALYDHDLRFFLVEGRGIEEGIRSPFLEGKRLRDVFPPEVYERDEKALQAALDGQETTSEVQYDQRFYVVHTVPVRDDRGEIIAGMVMTQDVTKRKQAERAPVEYEKLRLALEREHELHALQNKIMQIISHEFRTPLAIISSSSGLLERYFDQLSGDKRQERFQQIQSQIEHLSEMLEDISFASQGQVQQFTLRPSTFDLEALCREKIAALDMTIGANHQLVFITDGSLKQVSADRKMVRYILVNLLSNAIKYSPEGSTVHLKAYSADESIIIEVQDEGIGISLEDQSHIFEPFYRGSNTGAINGIGLGMSIVKEAVDMHGGTITITSHINGGTSIHVTLPQLPQSSS